MDNSGKTDTTPSVAFDTDILIWYFRGSVKAREFIRSIPYLRRKIVAPVFMELIQGCRDKLELKVIKRFVLENFSELLYSDENDAEKAIKLLEKFSLSDNLGSWDALIVAMALNRGYLLATANDKHYRLVERLNLIVFNP